MRSKLFVPASRPELFAKALASQADAVSVDLEDSVIESRKDEARTMVANFLQSPEVRASNKTIIVRCNALGTAHFEADLRAITQTGLGMLNLPKVQSADEIHITVDALASAETANGVMRPVGILANIESPKGLRLAAEIAAAHSRVVGLQLGLNDLFESLAIDRKDPANVHAAMFATRMAAGEAGVFTYDGAFADIHDKPGFRAEAGMARRLGYLGKSCIHPSQVSLANEVFTPADEEVKFALRILKATRQAEAGGAGAFTLDGIMIDLPAIRRAELIVVANQRATAAQ